MNEKNATPAGDPSGAPRVPLTDAEKLWRIRHSTSHVMAAAVMQIFPDAKFAIGPPIENGFYYDFDLPRALTPDDLDEISVKMKALVKQNDTFVRTEMSIDEATAYCREQGQEYKIELIEGLAERGETVVSFFKVGEFTDLCAGPHVGRSGNCKAFHLLKVAGAYWRGDSDRPMLQRIYGTAWKNKTDLAAYLELLEEAKKRDHRKLATELDLFSFNKLSPGAVFWHPKGWTVYQNLLAYSREVHEAGGYQEIHNPLIYNKSLFETSGHWAHYNEHMFKLESEGETYCIKPMNCPDNMVFYMRKKHSYRELPLRVLEYQTLHRNELSGALNGIFRVRQFTQDDGHVFVRPDQIETEIDSVLKMIQEIYATFDLDYRVNLSTRPDDFMGEPELWDKAEEALKRSIESNGLEYKVKEGDGAFYGPKIDFDVLDSLGRKWQCATVQLDFQLPLRFDLTYTDTDNLPKVPILIHRAIFGSIERFLGILLEHVGGAFPTWLAPVQVQLLSINDECAIACHAAAAK
ncbi:MAG: threonyl-tRNA synthetase, partial [Bradymonadia bacterium]